MTLPQRKPKAAKRASRWKSQAHRDWVRGFACAFCGSKTNTEVAHVRIGSGAGMGQKPDDWRSVPLCAGPNSDINGERGCHDRQHIIGERTFWQDYEACHGQTVEHLIADLSKASPRAREIVAAQRERELV